MSVVTLSVIFALSVPVIFLFVVRKFNGYLKTSVVDVQAGTTKKTAEDPLKKKTALQRMQAWFGEFRKDFSLYENNLLTIIFGMAAYLVAAEINPYLVESGTFTREQVIRIAGPFIEEVLKALVIIYLVRRYDFPISVGALYGFGAGIGFAMVENIEYILPRADIAFTVAYSRVFSTNLVHATCSGLIGSALAYLKFYRASRDYVFASFIAFVFGAGLHMGFNTMVNEGIYLFVALAVGLLGGSLIVWVSRMANRRHGSYAEEVINDEMRSSRNEAFIVRTEEDLRKVYKEVEAKFSAYHAQLTDDFLKTQVEIITKRKILEVTKNPGEVKRLEKDIEGLIDHINKVRNKLGWDCMVFVRTRYTTDEKLWVNIQDRIAAASTGQKGGGVWDMAANKIKQSKSQEENP